VTMCGALLYINHLSFVNKESHTAIIFLD